MNPLQFYKRSSMISKVMISICVLNVPFELRNAYKFFYNTDTNEAHNYYYRGNHFVKQTQREPSRHVIAKEAEDKLPIK